MSTQSIIAVKQFTGPARTAHTCTAPQPSAHQLLSAKYDNCGASQAELSDPISPSSSSTFCTSMYSSSLLTNSKSCRQADALPFLPHPPKSEQQQTSGGQSSSSSSLLFGTDLNNGGQSEAEHSADLKDFLNLSGDASEGSFHGENDGMAFREQMEFQFLSEQLGIAITNNEESPQLDVSP